MELLIVDDSRNICLLIEAWAEKHDFEDILFAHDGFTALDLIQKHQPELVTLDLGLPEIDGMTLLSRVFSLSPDTKVIVISGSPDKAEKAVGMGAHAMLVKPPSEEDFDRVVGELLQVG